MKYIDLFAGVGGFRYGIDRVNRWLTKTSSNEKRQHLSNPNPSDGNGRRTDTFSCVYSNEWDKYANSVYRKHFKSCDQRDIRKVDTGEIPDHDLLVGGFPCQSFSIAGKRGGFSDTRGTLFFEIARIVKQKQPRLLLLENVKGLLSHDKGKTFETIIYTLDELGYDCQWQVLNSKNFGVPQNRERVFIIGHLRGTSRPQVFPIRQNDNPLITKGGKQASDAVISRTLTATDAKMHLDGNYIKQLVGGSQGNRVYDPSGVSVTIASQAGGQGAKTGLYAIPVLTPNRPEKRQNGRRFKTDGEPSFTLTAQDKHGIYDGAKIRRLTPTECERLQGFPDGWTALDADNKPVSDTQRYKMMGNAVTTNVITEIVSRLVEAL